MTSPAFDFSELRTFAKDLGRASFETADDVRRTIAESAGKVRKTMRADMKKSRSFGALANRISSETRISNTAIEAEIGVRRRTGGHGDADLGFGANIAYFGTSRGGGTVRDPQAALDEEVPAFEKALSDLLGDVL